MPLIFVPMLGLMGIGIVMIRRHVQVSRGVPYEDVASRLLGWAVGLMTASRREWGRAMIGELAHIEGPARRLRFALGCLGAALVLPPWGPAAVGVWVMVLLAAGGVAVQVDVVLHYRLGGAGWVSAAVAAISV